MNLKLASKSTTTAFLTASSCDSVFPTKEIKGSTETINTVGFHSPRAESSSHPDRAATSTQNLVRSKDVPPSSQRFAEALADSIRWREYLMSSSYSTARRMA